MWVILLEGLGAGALFVLIVWWTMFSGRKGGERIQVADAEHLGNAHDQHHDHVAPHTRENDAGKPARPDNDQG